MQENNGEYQNRFKPKEVNLPKDYKFYNNNFFFKIIQFLTVLLTSAYLIFPKIFVWGFKIKGKKNFKLHPKGNVIVCNHAFILDAFLLTTSLLPRRIFTTTLEANMGFTGFSRYIRLGGAVPIPASLKNMRGFIKETNELIKNGGNVCLMPEASLVLYSDHIREFMPGAFHFAYEAGATIIPACYTFHKRHGLYKVFGYKNPSVTLDFLPPYQIKDMGSKKETIENASKEVRDIMETYFTTQSDYFR